MQRSGYPEAYEAHAPDARALASALTGYSPGGAFTCVVDASRDGHGSLRLGGPRALTKAYGRTRTSPGDRLPAGLHRRASRPARTATARAGRSRRTSLAHADELRSTGSPTTAAPGGRATTRSDGLGAVVGGRHHAHASRSADRDRPTAADRRLGDSPKRPCQTYRFARFGRGAIARGMLVRSQPGRNSWSRQSSTRWVRRWPRAKDQRLPVELLVGNDWLTAACSPSTATASCSRHDTPSTAWSGSRSSTPCARRVDRGPADPATSRRWVPRADRSGRAAATAASTRSSVAVSATRTCRAPGGAVERPRARPGSRARRASDSVSSSPRRGCAHR